MSEIYNRKKFIKPKDFEQYNNTHSNITTKCYINKISPTACEKKCNNDTNCLGFNEINFPSRQQHIKKCCLKYPNLNNARANMTNNTGYQSR